MGGEASGARRGYLNGLTCAVLLLSGLGGCSAGGDGGQAAEPWSGPPAKLVSVAANGSLPNERSSVPFPPVAPVVTPDGRFVAFTSLAHNLVPDDTSRSHEFSEIFVRDVEKGTIERVNVSSDEEQANQGRKAGDDYYLVYPDSALGGISDDGRYVVFASTSSNLVPGDTNGSWDVFVRDRRRGTTSRVSLSSSGAQGNEDSFNPVISANGRVVAFASGASNLVRRDTNRVADVFVHHLRSGRTERASVTEDGRKADIDDVRFGRSDQPSLSADGRVVAFYSDADNLVADDTNDLTDVFVSDLRGGEVVRASVSSSGEETDGSWEEGEHYLGPSANVSLSGDGTVVMFTSGAGNLVEGDTNELVDAFVHDLDTGETERVSVGTDGEQVTGCLDEECDDGSTGGAISFDGRLVAFTSTGVFGPDDRDNPYGTDHDIYIRDRATDRTFFVTYRYDGDLPAPGNIYGPSLSSNGRWMVYGSDDKKMVRATRGTEAFGWVFLQRLPADLFE